MNIIDRVDFLLRPFSPDTLNLFFSFLRRHMEIHTLDYRAGVTGFSSPEKCFFIVPSAWCCCNCIEPCLATFFPHQFPYLMAGFFCFYPFFFSHACSVCSSFLLKKTRRSRFLLQSFVSLLFLSALLIEDGGSFISSVSYRGTCLFSVTRDDIEGIDYLHCTWRWLELLFPHDVLWRVHGVIY